MLKSFLNISFLFIWNLLWKCTHLMGTTCKNLKSVITLCCTKTQYYFQPINWLRHIISPHPPGLHSNHCRSTDNHALTTGNIGVRALLRWNPQIGRTSVKNNFEGLPGSSYLYCAVILCIEIVGQRLRTAIFCRVFVVQPLLRFFQQFFLWNSNIFKCISDGSKFVQWDPTREIYTLT